MTLQAKIEPIQNHAGVGDPAKKITFLDKITCSSCGSEIDTDEPVSLCHYENSLHCDECKNMGKMDSAGRKVSGTVKQSTRFLVKYFDQKNSREKIREEFVEQYKENLGDDEELPDEETIESMVEKRFERQKSDREKFKEEAIPLTSI